ncbi:MAG TPA: C-GCAxxG-C-C family protein [Gammaproteobacteria bacterium]|jgi:C_GCAxxG_C_C family probable redox protein|nr:C-GCAxxG-C-C family protein [Gammaproteobacteria bacterium]
MDAPSKTDLAQQAYELAMTYELEYGCCPQCVLAAVQETVGGVAPEVIKAVHGLSGGGGLMGMGTCGALSGGLVALSTKRGRDRDKFERGKFIGNFRQGEELVNRFKEEFGGVTCQELQHCFTGKTYDMWDAQQYADFTEKRGNQCARASALVAQWVVEKLA